MGRKRQIRNQAGTSRVGRDGRVSQVACEFANRSQASPCALSTHLGGIFEGSRSGSAHVHAKQSRCKSALNLLGRKLGQLRRTYLALWSILGSTAESKWLRSLTETSRS